MNKDQRLQNERANQNYFSGKVSELSRYIAYGLIAVVFGFISTDNTYFSGLSAAHKVDVAISAILAIVSVSIDYLQHFLGYLGATTAANNPKEDYKRPPLGKVLMAVQLVGFYIKQALVAWGVILFLSILFQNMNF